MKAVLKSAELQTINFVRVLAIYNANRKPQISKHEFGKLLFPEMDGAALRQRTNRLFNGKTTKYEIELLLKTASLINIDVNKLIKL